MDFPLKVQNPTGTNTPVLTNIDHKKSNGKKAPPVELPESRQYSSEDSGENSYRGRTLERIILAICTAICADPNA